MSCIGRFIAATGKHLPKRRQAIAAISLLRLSASVDKSLVLAPAEILARQLHGRSAGTLRKFITMDINPFSHHERALGLRALRSEILSSNIANADTPNYKARDIDFAEAMRNVKSTQVTMRKTNPLHQSPLTTNRLAAEVKYRVPMQSTLDGNTVETDVEQALFAENTVRYRASLTFLNGQINGLRYAIRGGE